MKNTFLLVAALGMSSFSFAQKDEIKAASKAMKSGDAAAVIAALAPAAGSIDSADDKYIAQFYFMQGEALAMQATAGDFSAYDKAIASYNKALANEEASGKSKYSAD